MKKQKIIVIHKHLTVKEVRKAMKHAEDDWLLCLNEHGGEIIFAGIAPNHDIMTVDWSKMEQP